MCSDNLEENIRAVRRGLVARTIDRNDMMKALPIPVLVTEGEKDDLVLATLRLLKTHSD